MYVFKAAVVGAGTMGGEIAQVIASAGVDVVLKDVEQKFVDQGLEKAEQVTQGPARRARQEGEDHPGAGRQAGRGDRSAGSPARPTTTGFGDVDFVVEAVPERMQIKQAVFAELDAVTPGHAILAVEHVGAVDHRDGRGHAAAPTRSSASTSSTPRR